jgi:hypothetical protein
LLSPKKENPLFRVGCFRFYFLRQPHSLDLGVKPPVAKSKRVVGPHEGSV